MSTHEEFLQQIRGGLIVSCQALRGEAFRDSASIARFARAAVAGGAVGIRAASPEDIRAIRAAVDLPVIGIEKRMMEDGRILITPTFEDARALVEAGASAIAIDCTTRGQRFGALDVVRRIREELGAPVMADIATLEEAVAAEAAGASIAGSTMRGYTDETEGVDVFQPEFIRELAGRLGIPVIAEGRVNTPREAAEALRAGAWAVVVGAAITRPHEVTRWFVKAMRPAPDCVVAIDLGGTNTKSGIVTAAGKLLEERTTPTPFSSGRRALLEHLKRITADTREDAQRIGRRPERVGIATGGWVEPRSGRIVFATDYVPGWTGAEVAREVRESCGLEVAVENDANAAAVGEHCFGAARGVDHFLCVTLGTGIGGGCYVGGRLNHGARCFANALGHVCVVADGRPCFCGLKGCVEAYASAAALVGYAGSGYESAKAVIEAANAGDRTALDAVRTLARYLAMGISSAVQVLDPELVILSGGLVQSNPTLIEEFTRELRSRVIVPEQRGLRVAVSTLGYHAGVLGAAAVAMERE